MMIGVHPWSLDSQRNRWGPSQWLAAAGSGNFLNRPLYYCLYIVLYKYASVRIAGKYNPFFCTVHKNIRFKP